MLEDSQSNLNTLLQSQMQGCIFVLSERLRTSFGRVRDNGFSSIYSVAKGNKGRTSFVGGGLFKSGGNSPSSGGQTLIFFSSFKLSRESSGFRFRCRIVRDSIVLDSSCLEEKTCLNQIRKLEFLRQILMFVLI